MKRFLAGGLCTALLLVAGSSYAHWESGATLLKGNLGYVTAKSGLTTDTVHGASFNGGLDFVIPDEPLSFGLWLGSIVFDENGQLPPEEGGETAELRYSSFPVHGNFKAWFGGDRVRGYAGLGIGFHSSRLERSVGSDYRIETTSGFAFGVPVGAVLFLGNNVFLSWNLTLHILGDSLYDSNVLGMANGGIGFKLSDW